jgi:hypothetical protein
MEKSILFALLAGVGIFILLANVEGNAKYLVAVIWFLGWLQGKATR